MMKENEGGSRTLPSHFLPLVVAAFYVSVIRRWEGTLAKGFATAVGDGRLLLMRHGRAHSGVAGR